MQFLSQDLVSTVQDGHIERFLAPQILFCLLGVHKLKIEKQGKSILSNLVEEGIKVLVALKVPVEL